ncbi:LysR family transcriptional regulator [Sphingomonas sp.]|uniref:LysR family transcriptional regulator n=1 Tax=Sphingomonas sp. TaxID=28214 RepID=UPI0035C7BF07
MGDEEINVADVQALMLVVQAGGFREAARLAERSSSGLSASVRRLERQLGTRLLYRTTRSITPTEAGRRMIDRLEPVFAELSLTLREARGTPGAPAGTLRLNVPVSAARLILPPLIAEFLTLYPAITVEVVAQSELLDVLAAEFDAGIRYYDKVPADMVGIPIGPRQQRFATVAAPAYLDRAGRPIHPDDLARHACICERTANRTVPLWEFERDGACVSIEPKGRLITGRGATADLAVAVAKQGLGILHIFEEWIRPEIEAGVLVPVLEDWWQAFPGPYLYYPGGGLVPPTLRAFVDFLKARGA